VHSENKLFGEYREPCFNPKLAFYKNALEDGGFKVTHIERFERPTPLGEGAVEWFQIINRTMHLLKQHYVFDGNSWTADFVRLPLSYTFTKLKGSSP